MALGTAKLIDLAPWLPPKINIRGFLDLSGNSLGGCLLSMISCRTGLPKYWQSPVKNFVIPPTAPGNPSITAYAAVHARYRFARPAFAFCS